MPLGGWSEGGGVRETSMGMSLGRWWSPLVSCSVTARGEGEGSGEWRNLRLLEVCWWVVSGRSS